jgi:hypothetical protein
MNPRFLLCRRKINQPTQKWYENLDERTQKTYRIKLKKDLCVGAGLGTFTDRKAWRERVFAGAREGE